MPIIVNFHDTGGVEAVVDVIGQSSDALPTIDPNNLLLDQRHAYDIVDWHLQQTISGQHPPQLLMIIAGEGGVGKSRTIQAITKIFHLKHEPLVKAAYTGIAASMVDGKTLHIIRMLSLNGRKPSAKLARKLVAMWANKRYLIIDEILIVSKVLLAKLSAIITIAKTEQDQPLSDEPFGGLNVIIVGDFHQFLPVVTKRSTPLFWPRNPSADTREEGIG